MLTAASTEGALPPAMVEWVKQLGLSDSKQVEFTRFLCSDDEYGASLARTRTHTHAHARTRMPTRTNVHAYRTERTL